MLFSKCIDNSANVVVSTRLQDLKNSKNLTVTTKRLIPRPAGRKANTFEEECNIFENFQEIDDEGQRPHESIGNSTQRDTPIKRNALLNKQKTTHRTSRNASPKYSKTNGSKMFESGSNTFIDNSRLNDLISNNSTL